MAASTAFNTSILTTLSKGIQKGKELAPTAKIYLYGGHGTDVCNKETKEVLIGVVPDDCIYITIGECGRVTYTDRKREAFFASTKEEDKQLFRDMFQSEAKRVEFAKKANVSPDNLHIHYPGMKYVVNNFSPIAIYSTDIGTLTMGNKKKGTTLSKSGLIDKSKYEGLTSAEINFTMLEDYIDQLSKMSEFKHLIPRKYGLQVLQHMFQDSPHITKLLESNKAKRLYEEMVPKKDKIYASVTKDFIEELFFKYPKESVIEQFSASVAPTPEEVEALLDKKRYSDRDLLRLTDKLVSPGQYSYVHNSSSPFTNTNLMKRFPGIHFNLTCRDTSKECEAHTETRRQESEQVSAHLRTRMNTPKNTIGDDFVYIIERIEEIVMRHEESDIAKKSYAVFQSLSSLKDILNTLNTREKEQVLEYLEYDGILPEKKNTTSLTKIQKKIVHLLFPEKNTSPKTNIQTRKTNRRNNSTRKN